MSRITMLARLQGCGLALMMAALVLLSGRLFVAQSAGTVIGISGDCFVVSGGSRTALRLGQAVQVGDILDVAAPAKLKLRMADGSIISVAAGTQMTIRAYAVDAAGQRQDASSVARAGIVARRRGAGHRAGEVRGRYRRRHRRGALDRLVCRGVPRRRCRSGVLTGTIVMTSGATGRERHDPGALGRRGSKPGATRCRRAYGARRSSMRSSPAPRCPKAGRIALAEASRGRAASAKPGWRCSSPSG